MGKILILLFLLLYSPHSLAANAPYFVSTKSSKTNMRTGPGFDYPIKWIYVCNNLPFKVIDEFENWKKVCDIDENCGWIKSNLLSNKHYVMIRGDTFGYKERNIESKVVLLIDKSVLMKVEKCNQEWCLLSVQKHKAWIQKEFIWGCG